MKMRSVLFLLILFVIMVLPLKAQMLEPDDVELTWAASLSGPEIVAGYNMYRSETSGSDYVQINADLITGLVYVDDTLEWGKIYYYVCRAVSHWGIESGNSNEAMWTVPVPPAPDAPTGLDVKKN